MVVQNSTGMPRGWNHGLCLKPGSNFADTKMSASQEQSWCRLSLHSGRPGAMRWRFDCLTCTISWKSPVDMHATEHWIRPDDNPLSADLIVPKQKGDPVLPQGRAVETVKPDQMSRPGFRTVLLIVCNLQNTRVQETLGSAGTINRQQGILPEVDSDSTHHRMCGVFIVFFVLVATNI